MFFRIIQNLLLIILVLFVTNNRGFCSNKIHFFQETDDSTSGIEEETIEKIISGDIIYDKYSSGTGMQNVMKRIKLYFGRGYGLSIENVPAGGTKIILRMRNNSEV